MSSQLRNSQSHNKMGEFGYGWFECTCCPYGYHIDLDFVRYCESIGKETDNKTGSIKKRKDRRKQRQSMEVLLGLTPPVLAALEQKFKSVDEHESPKIVKKQTTLQQLSSNNDAYDLNDAISDFEMTLQRSKNKLSNNLPDVTAVSDNLQRTRSNSSLSSASGSMQVLPAVAQDGHMRNDFDTVSLESCGLSPMALQNIRESLALSLERTRELEDQVRLIPELKEQLHILEDENLRLLRILKTEQQTNTNLNDLNGGYLHSHTSNDRIRSKSFTHIDTGLNNWKKKELLPSPPSPPPRKDFGVMCGVLTRNVGVGHYYPNTKSVSTLTCHEPEFADKWLPEKMKFMNNQSLHDNYQHKLLVAKGTQTVVYSRDKRETGIQTVGLDIPIPVKPLQKITANCYTQTVLPTKNVKHVGLTVLPNVSNASVQSKVECYSAGCSDDTVDDIICEKCKILKKSIAVGPDKTEDIHTSSISLASLTSRSKSFNLGDDKLDMKTRTRNVGSQFELSIANKSCQSEIITTSKASQHEYKVTDKKTQSEYRGIPKETDTKDLTSTKHVSCETIQLEFDKPCSKCASEKDERDPKKDNSDAGSLSPVTPSRIPRPQIPTTPVEVRKFRRQDTYTKIYEKSLESPPAQNMLSGLNLTPKAISAETLSPFDKVRQSFTVELPSASHSTSPSTQNGVNSISSSLKTTQVQKPTLHSSDSETFQHIAQTERKKAVPSKEMQGAMKVLNDALQKNPSKLGTNHSAINIVQQEWFKISSLVTANPLDVEDYLDAFEDISSLLLEYIVNMTDNTGNTAMHYAVSHGNFDVVSILLDSKVCDINKFNKTGYTSVMLVSLAEVRSETHANVVRRLFQMADVNLKAKQHGQTTLMLAVSHGRLDMVKMLLEAGAGINIQDEDGSTALMCAAEHGQIDIVKHFLTHPDCDSSITDVDGSTALKIAMEAGYRHIGVLLYAHERNNQKLHSKLKKTSSASPKTPSSPLPIRSSHRALTDTKK